MMDFLREFNIKNEEIEQITAALSPQMQKYLDVMQNNVYEVLTFLKGFGINRFKDILIKRPDIFLKSKDYLEMEFKEIAPDLLINILENRIEDLSCFEI